MIFLNDEEIDIVNVDQDEKIFLAYYQNVKEELGEAKCAWINKKPEDSDIIIFESLDRSEEETRFIYEEGYGCEGNYSEVCHICTASVFHMAGGEHQPMKPDIPADQLEEILKNYKERGFQLPYKLRVPTIIEHDGTKSDQLIVVISTLENMGDDEDYEEEEEE